MFICLTQMCMFCCRNVNLFVNGMLHEALGGLQNSIIFLKAVKFGVS